MKNRNKHMLFSICAVVVSAIMTFMTPANALFSAFVKPEVLPSAAVSRNYELVDDVQDAAVLHCWNWSYATIEENLQLIAECGYSAVQTSPATQPKDYSYKGVVGTDVGTPGEGGSGNWWKLYQPVTESVCDNGQTWLGTKAELEQLCEKAQEYGIKVIVDIVANHLGNITGWKNSLTDVSPQVGEYWNPDMLVDESFWHINDLQVWMSDGREHFTQGSMGMPDLNTADKRVQTYIANYLDELIDCGVDGFRFDAAKHIETPDDDPSFASDFWPTVLGEAESYYAAKTGEDLYVYGEILNTVGDNFSVDSYTKYMSITDNSAGNHLLEAFRNNNVGTLGMDYAPEVSVLWAESHDTYMNESSRYASDKSVVRTWSMVANKDNAAALYFVRPYYSSDTLVDDQDGNFKSNLKATLTQAQMGKCETYTWASKEVAAVNHFNNRFAAYSDNMGTDGRVAYCVRGQGIVLTNFDGAGHISMSSHGLADGTYTDEVSGNTFTVSGGRISGDITSEYGIAVVYKNVMSNPGESYPVQIKNSVGDGTVFYSDSLNVTIDATYATNASYVASTGETGTFSGSTTITIGAGLSKGETVTLTITGSNEKGTVTQTYTYTKEEYTLENCIFFKNTAGWSSVTAYLWNNQATPSVTNAGWPGEKMFECDAANGIYALAINPDAGYNKIIFSNNGGSQTADLAVGEIGYMYNNGTWELYKEVGETTPQISTTLNSSVITDAVNVTYSVKNATSATYSINGGTKLPFTNSISLSVGNSLNEGATYTVVIEAVNGSKTKTETYKYTMDYTQPEVMASVETGKIFKDSLTVTFTAKSAQSATISVNGVESQFTGSITKTFLATSTVIVKAVNGTKNATGTFNYTLYVPVDPTVSASVASGASFSDSMTVTFTVKDALTSSISDGATTKAFTDTVTVTAKATTTYTITASNGVKDYTFTYTYTYVEPSDNYVYFNVSACGWFGNDKAVLGAKFNTESSYTAGEKITYNGVTYYKVAVPDKATTVSIGRLLPSGNTYNVLNVTLSNGKNVWTGNSGFNGGSWSNVAGLGQTVVTPPVGDTMTVYFVNNYDLNGTIKAYYWGGGASVSWPGEAMTKVSVNASGKTVYKITVPTGITGLIFTNGSSQTVDITTNLKDGTLFTLSGNSGSKYTVTASTY